MENSPHHINQVQKKPILPEGLSAKDIELVYRQCELQQATSKKQLEGFATAYLKAKQFTKDLSLVNLNGEVILDLVLDLASLIESRNSKGFRTTPVRFKNHNQAIDAGLVPRAMEVFSIAYAEGELDSISLYREFEEIHPFEDGNGRVGDLLWKIAITRETGNWPEEIPPDIFAGKN